MFFKSFVFHPDSISGEGLDQDEDGDVIYSFSVRSKILSILFRKTEDDIESYKLGFNASERCSVNERFRFQIEIKTKSLIRKQYNPFYQPCKVDKLGVSKKYKKALLELPLRSDELEDAVRDEEDEINYMMISNSILKGFLENVSSATEDFKLEVNNKNFSITAFTKGIFVKEKEILKQPMAVNIVFNTDELLDLKLFDNRDKKIIYRLKDFKTFLNLGASSEFIEAWFKKPGDPVLFELNRNGCLIQFVQVTDGENNHHLDSRHTRVIEREKVNKRRKETRKSKQSSRPVPQEDYDHNTEIENEFVQPLFVPLDDDEDIAVAEKPKQTTSSTTPRSPVKVPRMRNSILNAATASESIEAKDNEANHKSDEISWGEPSSKDQMISQLINNSKSDERRMINEAKLKYLNDIKKRKLESTRYGDAGDGGEDELGPTQDIARVKGIFE